MDICGVSEHWLYDHDLHFLDCIDINYSCYAMADFDLSTPGNRRVGKGGVCFMWKKQYDQRITRIELGDDRIIGIRYEMAKDCYLYVFQVYLPCSNHPMDYYRENIDNIFNLLSMYKDSGVVVVMGDFNAHINGSQRFIKPMDERGLLLSNFLHENNLVSVNTCDMCAGVGSTFVSYNGCSESFIDHIIVEQERFDTVKRCVILDDDVLNVSRHRPVLCEIGFPVTGTTSDILHLPNKRTNWKKANSEHIRAYSEGLTDHLNSYMYQHLNDIYYNPDMVDTVYDMLVQSMITACDSCIPKSNYKPFLKPYWNSSLKDLHKHEMEMRQAWMSDGRPRGHDHPSYSNYKLAKRRFSSIS